MFGRSSLDAPITGLDELPADAPRQPWIVYDLMRIDEAVTTGGGVWVSLVVLLVVYTAMGVGAVMVLRSMAQRWREGAPLDLPTP